MLLCEIQGEGLSNAMTAHEALAFVGDEPCVVTMLNDDKLYLIAPPTPPKSRSRRQRRDTSSETMDLVVRKHWKKLNILQFVGQTVSASAHRVSAMSFYWFLFFLRSSLVMESGMWAQCTLRRKMRFLFTSSSQL